MQICTLTQTHNHASIPPLSFFTGQMPFLLPNQQHQRTEGKSTCNKKICLTQISNTFGGGAIVTAHPSTALYKCRSRYSMNCSSRDVWRHNPYTSLSKMTNYETKQKIKHAKITTFTVQISEMQLDIKLYTFMSFRWKLKSKHFCPLVEDLAKISLQPSMQAR